MRRVSVDAETFGTLDLNAAGPWLYSRHDATGVWCVSYCLEVDGVRGEIKTWLPGDPVPAEIIETAGDPEGVVIAHGSGFDRQIWENILTPRYQWPVIPLERHRCSMAAVLARALPAKLDQAAAALGIATRKDPKSVAVMRKLAKPRKQTKKEIREGKPPEFTATPEELAILYAYNRIDVAIDMEVVDRVGLLSPAEQTLWELDQRINSRGVHCDIALLEAGICIGEEAKVELQDALAGLTGGAVTTAKQTEKIKAWLAANGCPIADMQKPTISAALRRKGLSPAVRRVLELRQGGAGAASLKFTALRRRAGEDNRLRDGYRFHGASSGRWTSLKIQLQNLRKPELEDVQAAIDAVATGSLGEMQRRGFALPLETIGHVTRATITAAPGKRLFIADLSGSRGARRRGNRRCYSSPRSMAHVRLHRQSRGRTLLPGRAQDICTIVGESAQDRQNRMAGVPVRRIDRRLSQSLGRPRDAGRNHPIAPQRVAPGQSGVRSILAPVDHASRTGDQASGRDLQGARSGVPLRSGNRLPRNAPPVRPLSHLSTRAPASP